MPETICAGTVNFGRDDTKAHHQHNLDAVHDFLEDQRRQGHAILVLLQEIMEGDRYDERAMLFATFRGYDFALGHSMTPIMSYGLDLLHAHSHRASKGIPRVTPARFVVDAVYEHPDTQQRIGAVNLHPPQGAFTDPGQTYEAERRQDYAANWALGLRRLHTDLATGTPMFFGGDLNNPHPDKPHPRAVSLINASLDHLWFVSDRPNGASFRQLRSHMVNLTIDGHNGQFVTGELHR